MEETQERIGGQGTERKGETEKMWPNYTSSQTVHTAIYCTQFDITAVLIKEDGLISTPPK